MSRHLLSKRAMSVVIAFVMLFSLFFGVMPAKAASDYGWYGINILNSNEHGGFEGIPDAKGLVGNWFLEGWMKGYTAEVAAPGRSGEGHCQKLTAAGSPVGAMTFGWIAGFDTTKEYRIKFWAKVTQGNLNFNIYEVITNWVYPYDMLETLIVKNEPEWKEYTYIYKPQAGAQCIGINFGSDSEMTAYIDDVTIEEFVTAPVITLEQPENNTVTTAAAITVSGTVYDEGGDLAKVTVNGEEVALTNGAFSTYVDLAPGSNSIAIIAEDARSNIDSKIIAVTRQSDDYPPEITLVNKENSFVTGQVGMEFTVSGEVSDREDAASALTVKIDVNGVVSDVVPEDDGKFEKKVALTLTGKNDISVTALDTKGQEARKTLSVVLKVERTQQPYDIGAFYFSNWNPTFSPGRIENAKKIFGPDSDWFSGIRETLLAPNFWGNGPIADREPLLGWYNDMEQRTLDNHILQAASRGIDHFAFYYYWEWQGAKERAGQNIELWDTSPYRDLMDYYIYYVADGGYTAADWRERIVPKLISFMKKPYYKRSKSDDPIMNDRPILGLFADMKSRMGGTNERLKEELNYLRTKAVEAGVGDPILLYDGYRTLNNFMDQGYDGFLPLCLAGIGLDDNIGVPEDYASAYPEAWKEFVYADYTEYNAGKTPIEQYQNYEDYLFIPGGLNAFDVRPWEGVGNVSGNYMYADPSPEKFKIQLKNVKDYLDTHERSMNMATFYAWNEWGEGGSIEPNTLFGYGYIDAMQEVFGLKNEDYKASLSKDSSLTDIAPDVRIDVEPQWSSVTMGQDVVLKTRVKNYSDTQAKGTLTLIQPAKNAEGKEQPVWTVKSAVDVSFDLAPGEAVDKEFLVAVGEGESWSRHNFIISDGNRDISTFVVKSAPFHALLKKDEIKVYTESKFDIILTTRNYTMQDKDVNYTLKLPRGWTSDEGTGTVKLKGYSGTGVHTDRIVKKRVTVSCPNDVQNGEYTIRLITSDGEFSKEDSFTVKITDLVYHGGMVVNGNFETDEDQDGKPDGWILVKPNDVTATMSLEKSQGMAYTGSGASLKITSPQGTNDSGVYVKEEEFHEVIPGETYVIDFYGRVPSTGTIKLMVEEKASESSEESSLRILSGNDVPNEWHNPSWTKISEQYTPAEGMKYVRIAFRNWGVNRLEGYIDNVSFKLKAGSTGYVPVIIPDQEEAVVTSPRFTVSGTVYDNNGDLKEVTVNGAVVAIDGNDRFSKTINLNEGENTIIVVAEDNAGNITRETITVTLQSSPVITVDQEDGTIADKRKFTVSGTVTDADGDLSSITVNGDQVVNNNGRFAVEIKLDKGINTIVVAATDAAGNMTEKIISVKYKESKR